MFEFVVWFGMVVVEVGFCGICGIDLYGFFLD